MTKTMESIINAINSGGLSGSRLKFAGAEDLGNGMKAIFEYEFGTAIESGTVYTVTWRDGTDPKTMARHTPISTR